MKATAIILAFLAVLFGHELSFGQKAGKTPALASNQNQLIGVWNLNHEPGILEIGKDGYKFWIPLDENGLYTKDKSKHQLFESGKWSFQNGNISFQPEQQGQEKRSQKAYLMGDYLFLGDYEQEVKENAEVQELNPSEYFIEWGYKRGKKSKK